MRRILLLAILATVATVAVPHACEDEESVRENTADVKDDPDLGIEVRYIAPRTSSPTSSKPEPEGTKHGVRVRIASGKRSIEIGAKLVLDVAVTNVSGKPIHLFNLQRGLREACAISVTPPNSRPLRFSIRRKNGGPSRARDFVTLAPGETTKASVDIAPLLARMDAQAPGLHRIALVFSSPFEGKPYGLLTWNEMGYKEAASNAIEVDLTWPMWRSNRGVTAEVHRQVERLLDATGPDGALEPEYRELLVEMGPEAIVVLEEKLDGCMEASFDRSLQGWNALYALVAVRATALPHLTASPRAGRPASIFLMKLIDELAAPGKDHALAPILRDLANGRGEPVLYSVRMTRHTPRDGSRTVTVHGDGRVTLLDPAGKGRLQERTATLTAEAVRPLFAAFHGGLFWIQRPLRKSGAGKESLLRIEFLRGRKALHKVDVWETEAVAGNRHLGRIHKAFVGIEKLAREFVVSKKPGGEPEKKKD